MARITWQNVTAPDLSTSRAALQQAGNSLSSGFRGFADSFKDIEQQQKDAYSQEALARLAQVSDPNQLNSMMSGDGLAALGIEDPRYLNADAMQSILGRSKTLFDNQKTAADTANTQSTMNRRNRLLQGEVDQAAATLRGTDATTNATIAGAALTKKQTEAVKQNILNTKSIIETRNAKLEADKKLWEDENTGRDFKSAAQLEIKEANDFSTPFIQAAKQINDPEKLRKYLKENQEKVFKDPKKVNEALLEIYDKGAMYAEPDFTADANFILNQAALKRTADAKGIASQLTNENLGLNPNELIELAGRMYGTDQPLYQSIVESIRGLNQEQFQINPDINDALRNSQEVRTSFTSINEALNANTGKFLNNPAWGVVELLESGTGLYRGKYEELLTAMRNAGSDEGAKFWGVNNNDVLNTIENYVAETGENPDLVAAAVLSGQGTEARNWIQRAVPFVADAIIDGKKIEKEVNKIKTAFNDPNIQRSVSAARAERDRLETKTRKIEDLLRRTGLAITRNPGMSGSDYDGIVKKLVEQIEEIRGPISTPSTSSDFSFPKADKSQNKPRKFNNTNNN